MVRGFSITWAAISYIFTNKNMWLLLIIGVLLGLAVEYATLRLFADFFWALRFFWVLGWRRTVASYILAEAQISPFPVSKAFARGFGTLFTALWLTCWSASIALMEYLFFDVFAPYDAEWLLFAMILLMVIHVVQGVLNIFFVPLVADGITGFADVIRLTVLYFKHHALMIAQAMLGFVLCMAIICYVLAAISFLTSVNSLIFSTITYFVFLLVLTATETLLYIDLHYAVGKSDE